jgi:hypothetical protein
LAEKLCKEFYSGLNDEKNKLNINNINKFQEFDFYNEIQNGNKQINLSDVIGAKIEVSQIQEEKVENNVEVKEEKKEEKPQEKKEEKKEEKTKHEEEEEEDEEEGGEEDDN